MHSVIVSTADCSQRNSSVAHEFAEIIILPTNMKHSQSGANANPQAKDRVIPSAITSKLRVEIMNHLAWKERVSNEKSQATR